MPGPADRRAALILLALAILGVGARLVAGGSAPPGELGYRASTESRPARDSVAARAARLARPLARDERIDVDRAGAEELTRLPRIGPALAARIVADRDANGPFGSLAALDRVSGVGPTVLRAVGRHVVFSGVPRRAGVSRATGRAIVSLNTATELQLRQLPGLGPRRARAIVDDRRRHGPYRRLEDLSRVRGIGPGTVARLRDHVRVP